MHSTALVPNKISNDRISIEAKKNTSITRIHISRRVEQVCCMIGCSQIYRNRAKNEQPVYLYLVYSISFNLLAVGTAYDINIICIHISRLPPEFEPFTFCNSNAYIPNYACPEAMC